MSKYHSKKITTPYGTFDSQKELRRWKELRLLERAGLISDLQRQVKFELIPTQREPDIIGKRGGHRPGKLIFKSCSYVADFVYTEDGKMVVEDVKGLRTKEYIIKCKLMLWIHDIRIKET